MGLVLWIDQNTFATGLLEKVFKKKNLPFYTIDNAENFVYLIDDLKPELLVLDSKTAIEFKEALERQYSNSDALKNLPVIQIDDFGDLPFLEKKIGTIKRPFDPFKIPSVLEEILRAN